MHKIPKATKKIKLQFPGHEKQVCHLPEVEGETVTSEKLKLHVTGMSSKITHPSGPGTLTQWH